MSDKVAGAILFQVGSNLRMLDSELEKLKIYAGKSPVTKEMIKEICVTNEDLFVFIDFLVNGNKSISLLEYLFLLANIYPL